jgi:hypothetical protein
MTIETFTSNVIRTGIFKTYIATGFFALLIFFTINSNLYTPMEMMIAVVILTVALKSVANMMLSLLILLFDYSSAEDEQKFKIEEEKLNLLLSEVKMNQARADAHKEL